MSVHTNDMSQIAAPGEVIDEGWYHVRISKVEEGDSKQGQPMVNLQLKIQTEGPMMGRMLFDNASLQPQALFKLKGYYKAINYNPGPEGHDPEKLLDGECYVYAEHEVYEGVKRAKVPPWSIRSMTEGAGKSTPKKA
jgi:hypothetical protein